MINLDDVAGKKIKNRNTNWSQIPDHLYRILKTGSSESRKTNALLNLINLHPKIDKIYLCSKDPYEAKYQLPIN